MLKQYVIANTDINWKNIHVGPMYRGFHSDSIKALADSILQGWFLGKPMLVVATQKDSGHFYIVDGVHRFHAVM